MVLPPKLCNKVLKLFNRAASIGKPNQYIYFCNRSMFFIRKDTSDRLIVDEVCRLKVYGSNIEKDATVVDVGANIGAYSLFAAKKATEGKVFSFEPENNNYRQLRKNIELNKIFNISTFRLGICDRECDTKLFLSDNNEGAHTLYKYDSCKIQKIKCIKLTDIFQQCKIKRADILKIDIEGAEYDILMSTSKKVFNKIDRIVLEFHDFLGLKYNSRHLIKFLENMEYDVDVKTPKIITKIYGFGILDAIKQ